MECERIELPVSTDRWVTATLHAMCNTPETKKAGLGCLRFHARPVQLASVWNLGLAERASYMRFNLTQGGTKGFCIILRPTSVI